eukprot:c23226_g1_i1.p1 GENE.c23226_g1_i1~~c23226_g1_i1.p1  ORF type:complete len:151 (-),score=52.45 c23226_g1_i1:22-474(-)
MGNNINIKCEKCFAQYNQLCTKISQLFSDLAVHTFTPQALNHKGDFIYQQKQSISNSQNLFSLLDSLCRLFRNINIISKSQKLGIENKYEIALQNLEKVLENLEISDESKILESDKNVITSDIEMQVTPNLQLQQTTSRADGFVELKEQN